MDWGRLGTGIATMGLSEVYDATQNKYKAPQAVTPEQIAAAQAQTQSGLAQQQNFVNATGAANGLGNQSSTFNQLQGVANGTGPNPAAAMLQQATGANVANQAALAASQRGAGANVGMMARGAAQQGANIQQQAAGQGATMQAQQSLGALGQMGGIAGQQVAQQAGALQGFNAAAQQNQGQLLGGQNAQNQLNAGVSAANAGTTTKLIGGALGGAGAAMGMADGGVVPDHQPQSFVGRHLKGLSTVAMAHGGHVDAMVSPQERYLPPSAVAAVAKGADPMASGEKIPGKPKVGGAKNHYENDTIPKTLEEGGIVLPRSVTQSDDPHGAAARFVSAILAKKGIPDKRRAK